MKKFLLKMITVCTVTAIAVTTALFFAGCSEFSDNPNGPNDSNNPNNPGGNSVNIEIEMVQIPGGSFQMGDTKNEGYNDEKPVHTVTLTGFYMGKYEVTQAQYQAVMGRNPSYFDGGSYREPASGEVQGNRPVESVSWYDAIVFCNKLSMAKNLSPAYSISGSTNPADWGSVPNWESNSTWDAVTIVSGSTGYRLPTEAQWEYAAKGGNGSPGNYTYAGSNTVGDVAWYWNNSDNKTHEVGKKAPNGLGLYDMSGNVWEWCWDWYAEYPSEAQIDPTGAASGSSRVGRGGYWDDHAGIARSVFRYIYDPNYWDYGVGFRLVRP
ncbi:MAG: formylglycine-generating enzyme family protein [Treponema sp.]|jgi:formylglycine-generating enzyme required for sulfatase activity|nr:formylglycine-generating enzyme family protein [Treponema sp.]